MNPKTWRDMVDRTRELELALGNTGPSPFSSAMKAGVATVEEFVEDVERGYKGQLR
jgi:sialic acid synthase SpsE